MALAILYPGRLSPPSRSMLVAAGTLAVFGWPLLAALWGLLASFLQWPADSLPFLEPRTLHVMLGSALLCAVTATATCLMGGLFLGALLGASDRSRKLLAFGLLCSFCLGSVIHLLAVRVYIVPASAVASWLAVVGILTLRYTPLAAGVFWLGLQAIDRAELETAIAMGGEGVAWRLLQRRLIPVAAILWFGVFVFCFGEGEVPPLLAVTVYAEEFLSQVALDPGGGQLPRYGLPFVLVGVLASALVVLLPGFFPSSGRLHSAGWPRVVGLPASRHGLPTLLAVAIAFAPLCLLSFALSMSAGRWPAGTGAALLNSLGYASCASAAAASSAWIAVEAMMVQRRGLLSFTAACLLLLFWPSTLVALEMVRLDLAYWIGADAVLVLAHAWRIFPYAALLMLGWRLADPVEREQQLVVLGVPATRRYLRIMVPFTSRRWFFAVVLGVCVSLGELSATVLTVPPGVETVILRIYNLMHYGDRLGVISLALLQSGAVALLAALGLWLLESRNDA